MKILIYKRTHTGDPNIDGIFGCEECMGSIRSHGFDAVIGVGGKGEEARSYFIDSLVNWIGIGPHRKVVDGKRGPEVTFEHFVLIEEKGPALRDLASGLARRLYDRGARHRSVCESDPEFAETKKILALAVEAPSSPARLSSSTSGVCGSREKRKPCGERSTRGTCRKVQGIANRSG